MVRFVAPIQPRRTSYVKGPAVTDPPLDVDALPGTLAAWQRRPDGWFGMVTYAFPTHGLGLGTYIDWFPADRLVLPDPAEAEKRG